MRDSTTNGLLINTKTAVHNQQWGPLDTKISMRYVDFTRKRKHFRREYKSSLDYKTETSRTLTNERRVSESLTNDETLSGSCHAQLVSQHLESLAQGKRSRSGAVRRAEQHARCGTQWWLYLQLYCQSKRSGPETRDTVQRDSRGRCEQKGWIRYILSVSRKKTPNYAPCPLRWAA